MTWMEYTWGMFAYSHQKWHACTIELLSQYFTTNSYKYNYALSLYTYSPTSTIRTLLANSKV